MENDMTPQPQPSGSGSSSPVVSENTPSTSTHSSIAKKGLDLAHTAGEEEEEDELLKNDEEEDVEMANSDVEIMEDDDYDDETTQKAEGKGKGTAMKKRKSEVTTGSKSDKKIKLDETVIGTASKGKGRAVKVPVEKKATKEKVEPQLVELNAKTRKLNLKQKAMPWDAFTSVVLGQVAFTSFFAEFLEAHKDQPTTKLTELPPTHYGVVARTIHESEKTLAQVTTETRKHLVKYILGSMPAEEESQESQETKSTASSAISDRICAVALSKLIAELAERVNYGIELDDLPNGLPEGVDEIPARLQIFRMELKDVNLFPTEMAAKLVRRKADRIAAKELAVTLFTDLSADDQLALLKDATTTKKAAVVKTTSVASGSGTAKKPKKAKKEVDSEAEAEKEEAKAKKLLEKVEKEREKAEKEREKEEKRAIREAEKAERDAKKQIKDDEIAAKKAKKASDDAAKLASEAKKKNATGKQAAALMGFFKKAPSASPAPADRRSVTPAAGNVVVAKESDFDRTFKPFRVKADTVLAPVRHYINSIKGKQVAEAKTNSRPSLTKEESLAALRARVPDHLIPPYNPHPTSAFSVRQIVQTISECEATGMDTREYFAMLSNRSALQVKFLKFHEDQLRPGYIGTWSKTSKVIGPRTPFGRDSALLEYEYDSEIEWEEEDDPLHQADDVNSGGERSDENDDEDSDGELSDDWLCGDDEVAFAEGCTAETMEAKMNLNSDDEGDVEMRAMEESRLRILERERKSKTGKDAQKKKKNTGALIPIVRGPMWEKRVGEIMLPAFNSMRIEFLNDAHIGLDPLKFVSTAVDRYSLTSAAVASTSKLVATPVATTSKATKPVKAKAPAKTVGSISAPSDAHRSSSIGAGTGAVGEVKKAAAPRAPPKPSKPLAEEHYPELIRLCLENSDLNKPPLIDLVAITMGKDHKGITKAAVGQTMKELGMTKDKTPGSKHFFPADILAKYSK